MKNKELAQIFYQISKYLRAENISFKPYAYYKAGDVLEKLQVDIKKVYQEGGLKKLEAMPGIGKNIALKIEEYLKTGEIAYFNKLKIPVDLTAITSIQGIGVKRAKRLYQELQIKDLKELEEAAKKGKIKRLKGFDLKTEKNILEGISFLKTNQGRFLLSHALTIARPIISALKKETLKVDLAGSLRRRKETVKDIDLLAASKNPLKTMEIFTSQEGVEKIWGKGETKASIRTEEKINVDLRIVPLKSYGAAWQYFTGSKDHNIILRKRAKRKGLKLNEYGLFKGKKQIAGKSEKEIYEKINLPWIPPELREDEIRIIPGLISLKDIKGDLHCHTNWSDGENTIEEMYEEAIKMGYHYLGISDHTKFLKAANGLDEKRLLEQSERIKRLKDKGYLILHGCEANILSNGSLDINDDLLRRLDYVIAGIHSELNKDITERVIKAMENPLVNIISHLSGRLIQERPESLMNFEKIIKKAKETNTLLEINATPKRLDLKAAYIEIAKKKGVRMVINSDAHNREQLKNMKYGVFQARRGGLERKDLLNVKKSLSF